MTSHETSNSRAVLRRLSRACWTALIVLSAANILRAHEIPDFSGKWRIASRGDGSPVWGHIRSRELTIEQTASEVRLCPEDGGLGIPSELQRYRLDGTESIFVDDSLGPLPNFVRKVRTRARFEGETLILQTEHLHESVETRSGQLQVGRAITAVLKLTRVGDDELVIERTGFRADPPAVLHGRPYRRDDDFVYNVDRVRYVRVKDHIH